MIFYEAPDRVGATLADLAAALGEGRRASLGRELTKLHEEHVRGTLGELAARYAETPPRGECTLVVEGGAPGAHAAVDIEAELPPPAGRGPRPPRRRRPPRDRHRQAAPPALPARALAPARARRRRARRWRGRRRMTATAPVQFTGGLPQLAARRRTLPCGLELVVHADHATPQVGVSVWYRVGSSDERPDRTGFAHLFEHLFKSPPERLGGHHYEVLKRAGATEANASTSADRTAYHEVVPAHQLPLALWLESERMGYFAPAFDEARLIAQQAVVRAERRQRYENVPYGAERFAIGLGAVPRGPPAAPPHDRPSRGHPGGDRRRRPRVLPDLVRAGERDAGDRGRRPRRPRRAGRPLLRQLPALAAAGAHDRRRPAAGAPRGPSCPIGSPRSARSTARGSGPRAFAAGDAELDILTTAWCAVGTGALWRRLVYETQLAQRVSAWTINGRLGGEVHVVVDLRTGADPAAVRAILDEECAPRRRRAGGLSRVHAPRGQHDLVAVDAAPAGQPDPARHALRRRSRTASPASSRGSARSRRRRSMRRSRGGCHRRTAWR